MISATRLDGGVPVDALAHQEVALAALARRVVELEHRLDMMKIIIGLVLAGKVLIVAAIIYVWTGHAFVVRSGSAGPAQRPLSSSYSIG